MQNEILYFMKTSYLLYNDNHNFVAVRVDLCYANLLSDVERFESVVSGSVMWKEG